MHDIGTPHDSTDLELCNFYQSDRRNNDRLLDNISVGEGQLELMLAMQMLLSKFFNFEMHPSEKDTDDKHTQDQEAGEARTALAVQTKEMPHFRKKKL